MGNSILQFKHPSRVPQVFQNINVYGKDKRSFDARKSDVEWKAFVSRSGFVREDELFLPDTLLQQSHFPNCDLITMEDNMLPIKEGEAVNNCFHLHHPNPLHIFQLKMEVELELFLKYGYFEVGIPKRNDFKLCELKLNEPVEIKINGKTDSSMSSGRARMYKEQYYIFNYLGQFTECTILRTPLAPVIKEVPEKRKEVDLLKTLW